MLAAIAPARDARAGEILAAVIRHAHDLAREVRLTPGELLAAADFLRRCGEISDAARHEYILLADVLGLTMVVDTEAADVADGALETSVLGPFYRAGAPWEPNGANISRGTDDGEPARIHGRVLDTSGAPVSGAVLDVWGTNSRGLYENVDPAQPDYNLRGRFRSGADGGYDLWTAKPVSYPIPGRRSGRGAARGDRPAQHAPRALPRDRLCGRATGPSSPSCTPTTTPTSTVTPSSASSRRLSFITTGSTARTALKAAGRTEPYWDLEYDFVLTPGRATPSGSARDASSPPDRRWSRRR